MQNIRDYLEAKKNLIINTPITKRYIKLQSIKGMIFSYFLSKN